MMFNSTLRTFRALTTVPRPHLAGRILPMPRLNDSPDIAASKTLSYLLRHGAEKESLHMRSDGYIRLADVLARPKMRGVDIEMVLWIVAENAKQRFELFYGYDPSPPVPKVKKGEGKKKKGPKAATANGNAGVASGQTVTSGSTDVQLRNGEPTADRSPGDSSSGPASTLQAPAVDAAAVDDIQHGLAKSHLSAPVELPLVNVPIPEPSAPLESTSASSYTTNGPGAGGTTTGEYFIRATQGHSLKVNDELHLEPVQNDDEGRRKVAYMVHGTKWELYDTIRAHGLSRMSRQHVHLAPALTNHHITPRNGSTLLIYLDLEKVLAASIPVYVSSNGVVLTPGDAEGRVPMDLWRKVERVEKEKRRVIWEDRKDVDPSVESSEGP